MFVTRSHMRERLDDSERFWKVLHDAAMETNKRLMAQYAEMVERYIAASADAERLRNNKEGK